MSETPSPEVPNFHASFGFKINTGNYENNDYSFGISGVPVDATPEYMEAVTEAAISRINFAIERFFKSYMDIKREVYKKYD